MTLRRHLSFALLGALLFASPFTAHAQDEEDPEPEVSDQGPDQQDPEPELADQGDIWDSLLQFSVTGGVDTPFGIGGGAVEFTPFRYLAIYAGGGIGRSGGRVAGGLRLQAPIGNGAVGLMSGVHGGPLDWESRGPQSEALHTSRHWDFALFWHGGITAEYRWDEGFFGRLSFGVEALMTPDADYCVRGTEGDRTECGVTSSNLSKPIRGWAGLTIGYALDL